MDDLPAPLRNRVGEWRCWRILATLASLAAASGCAQIQSKTKDFANRVNAEVDFARKKLQKPNIGNTAASYMKHIREDRNVNNRYLAYTKLANPECYVSKTEHDAAVSLLIDKFANGREPIASRAVIVRTLGELGDSRARETMLSAVDDPEAIIRAQACRALGRVGKKEDATVLTRKMTVDTLVDCRIAAIEAIGDLKPDDKRITMMLLNGMQHDEPAIRLASLEALKKMTGKDLGVDVVPWIKLLRPEMLASQPELASAGAPKPATGSKPKDDFQTTQTAFPFNLIERSQGTLSSLLSW